MTKNIYAVLKLNDSIVFKQNCIPPAPPLNLPALWETGMVGFFCVFDNRKDAGKYARGGYDVLTFEVEEND